MFEDRSSAGRELAKQLLHLAPSDPVVLALPRGGVPVAFEVARALNAPLDLLLVRKIGVPWQPELALGAIVDGAEPHLAIDRGLVAELGVTDTYIRAECDRQLAEIERRRKIYLGGRGSIGLRGRTVIVVDDGVATGSTVRAALDALRQAGAARIVLAVPVAPEDTVAALRPFVDEIVCLATPEPFIAIGAHYADFTQLADEEVVRLLDAARDLRQRPSAVAAGG
jgi:putative phosphoribosyl transferase